MEFDEKQLERDIQNALRARGLREQMQQWEAERKREQQGETQQEIRSLWPKARKWVYTMSVAAALIGVIVMAVPSSMRHSAYRQAYRQYAKWFGPTPSAPSTAPVYTYSIDQLMAMAAPSLKQIVDANEEKAILGHENLIHDAAWQVKAGNYDGAELLLQDGRAELGNGNADYYEQLDDIQYLEALCHLGQNRRTKAYKMLLGIAKSSSKHSAVAAELVEAISLSD